MITECNSCKYWIIWQLHSSPLLFTIDTTRVGFCGSLVREYITEVVYNMTLQISGTDFVQFLYILIFIIIYI